MEIQEYLSGEAPTLVGTGALDAAFIGPPEPARLRGLESRTIWIAPQEILLPANHPLAKRQRVKLLELRYESDEAFGACVSTRSLTRVATSQNHENFSGT
jgi:DNA-binding transcriptional LysR family regulator